MLQQHQTVLVNNGDLATLECSVIGIPTPVITWFKDEEEVIQSKKKKLYIKQQIFIFTANTAQSSIPLFQLSQYDYLEVTDSGALMIHGTQDMDAGEYVCVATNQAGTSEATVELVVGGMWVGGGGGGLLSESFIIREHF